MNTIYLLRHCEYDDSQKILPGRLPVPLSEHGQKQAQELKEYFSDKNIGAIYASAVLRCKQTVEAIADGKIDIQYDKRLLETLSAYQGYHYKDWDPEWHHFFSHREELGGEGLEDIQARVVPFFDEVSSNLSENIIICSHGDPIQVLYSHIYDLPLVSDDNLSEDTPGWIQKGEYVPIVWPLKK